MRLGTYCCQPETESPMTSKKVRDLGHDDIGKTVTIAQRTAPGILSMISFHGSNTFLRVDDDQLSIDDVDELVDVD